MGERAGRQAAAASTVVRDIKANKQREGERAKGKPGTVARRRRGGEVAAAELHSGLRMILGLDGGFNGIISKRNE